MITAAVILVGRLAMITTVVIVQPKAGSMPHGMLATSATCVTIGQLYGLLLLAGVIIAKRPTMITAAVITATSF